MAKTSYGRELIIRHFADFDKVVPWKAPQARNISEAFLQAPLPQTVGRPFVLTGRLILGDDHVRA